MVQRDPESGTVTLEYFTVPGASPDRHVVPESEVGGPNYERGLRVFTRDADGKIRSGRIAEDDLHEAELVSITYPGPVDSGPVLLIRLTGGEDISLPPEAVDICSDQAIEDPLPILATMSNEGSWWFHTRTAVARTLSAERAAFRGLSGLASSSIEINEHQIHVARQVLGDPVCRYILADEVGLGKTIEAGIVLRQHVIETEASFKALVVVPPLLRRQWTEELREKFMLGRDLRDGSIEVCAPEEVAEVIGDGWNGRNPEMLVIDEAHHLADLAFSIEPQHRETYNLLTELSDEAKRVLLLSATPVLRETSGFLAMLHLLDRGAYPLKDIDRFTAKVQAREQIAEIVFLLSKPVLRMFRRGLLSRIDEVVGSDTAALRLRDELAEAWEVEDDERAGVCRRKLHGYLRSAHQIYRRLIRTRRDDDAVVGALPARSIQTVEAPSDYYEDVSDFLDEWRLACLGKVLGTEWEAAARALFASWVSASLEGPNTLEDLLTKRVEALGGGDEGFFPGETDLVAEHRGRLMQLSGAAWAPVVEVLTEGQGGGLHLVFLSDERACRSVSDAIGQDVSIVGLDSGTFSDSVVFVPRRGEEGLNLQRESAKLVHGDVPLTVVRLEQRIGRVDRLGGANMVVESLVPVSPGTYQGAWVSALISSARVFRESVSPLQYILGEAESMMRLELLEHGREAFDRFADALSSDDGAYSLAQEVDRLAKQDTLDAAGLRRDTDWFMGIEEYEYGDGQEETTAAVTQWLSDGLRFRPLTPNGKSFDGRFSPQAPHRLKVTDKHLPRSHLRRWFSKAIDRDASGLPKFLVGRVTESLAGSRIKALKAGVALMRSGHPVVDGVAEMLLSDDRGRCFALVTPGGTGVPEPFLRFDFTLEGKLTDNDPTLRRRLEELLPPSYVTVWLDREGTVLAEAAATTLNQLVAGSAAKSIRGPEEWRDCVEPLELEWNRLTAALSEVAAGEVAARMEWLRAKGDAQDRLDELRIEVAAAQEARATLGQYDAESDLWTQEREFLERLDQIVRTAGPRLEALGVLFCSPSRLGLGK